MPRVSASWARLARLAAAPIGLAVAVGALLIAQGPGMFTTYAGRSGLAAGLMVAAGLALVLAGLLASLTSQAGPAGDLAVLAGIVWFAPVWVGWEVGPPLVRSIGMLAAGFVFPLLFYLVLAFPGGRLPATGTRALAWAVYLDEVQAGLGELRELAHGIYPAILTEAGLGPALATLADSASIPVELDDDVQSRYPELVETAAYLMVAEAIEDAAGRGAGYAAVTVAHRDGRLTVTVEDDGQGRTSPMSGIADRVGALDGILTIEPTRMGAQIPCG